MMTGYQSKKAASLDKLDDDDTQVYQQGYAITNAVQPTALTFNGGNSEWVMRITADRRIEVNEDVEVTEAAQKVLDALQHLIKPAQRTWVGLTNDEVNNFAAGCHLGNSVQGAIYKAEAKLKEKNA
jgi:hypothetical protein